MLKLQQKENDRSIWLIGPVMKLGSAKDNDLILFGDDIEDFHAELEIDGAKLLISPVNNSHCAVNGKDVAGCCEMGLGDELVIGSREFTVVDPKNEMPEQVSLANADEHEMTQVASAVVPAKIAASPAKAEWQLQSKQKSLNNKCYPLADMAVVGRSSDCELAFSFDRLSRKHAELRISDGKLFVKDLNSSNGTFLNGERLDGQAQLRPGDELSFDKLNFTVMGPPQKEAVNSAAAAESDDLNKTVIRPALSANALANKVAQAKEEQAANNTMVMSPVDVARGVKQGSNENYRPMEPKSNNSAVMIVASLLVVAGVAAVVLFK